MVARNKYRIEINMYEKELCVKLVIYRDCTEMHGQQNIKKRLYTCVQQHTDILQMTVTEQTQQVNANPLSHCHVDARQRTAGENEREAQLRATTNSASHRPQPSTNSTSKRPGVD